MLVAVVVAVSVFACSDKKTTATDTETTGSIIRVYPTNGATGVSTATGVSLVFAKSMVTSTIAANFYLAGGESMHEWHDSLDQMGGWGKMDTDSRTHMLDWVDSIHSGGSFHWNSTHDSCEFVPDPLLDPNTEYICLLNQDEMQHHIGGMMGRIHHGDDGLQMFGFTTGGGATGVQSIEARLSQLSK